MKNILFCFCSALIALVLCGCGASHNAAVAHLYRSYAGGREEVIEMTVSDPKADFGHLEIRTKTGKITGDYSPIAAPSEITSSKKNGISVKGPMIGGGIDSGSSSSMKFEPGMAWRSATLVGKSFVITLTFQVDPKTGHGSGTGRDNKGGFYRLQF